MIRSETRTIGGRDTSSTQFPAMRAIPLIVRLGKVVGPALVQLLSGDVDDIETMLKKDVSVITSAITELLFSLQPDGVTKLLRDLLQNTTVTHEGVAIDLNSDTSINGVFSGAALVYLVPTVKFVLELNFGDFFVAVASLAPEGDDQYKGSHLDSTKT